MVGAKQSFAGIKERSQVQLGNEGKNKISCTCFGSRRTPCDGPAYGVRGLPMERAQLVKMLYPLEELLEDVGVGLGGEDVAHARVGPGSGVPTLEVVHFGRADAGRIGEGLLVDD